MSNSYDVYMCRALIMGRSLERSISVIESIDFHALLFMDFWQEYDKASIKKLKRKNQTYDLYLCR